MDKDKIVVETIRAVIEWKRACAPELNLEQACFYWSVVGATHLCHKGIKANVMAGSMSWPRIKLPEEDDGIINTHFSYIWEPNSPATIKAILEGRMPEMHVWIYLLDTDEIIDLTTRYLVSQCTKLTGMRWSAPPPPDYLWCNRNDLPPDVVYQEHDSANKFAITLLIKIFNGPDPIFIDL